MCEIPSQLQLLGHGVSRQDLSSLGHPTRRYGPNVYGPLESRHLGGLFTGWENAGLGERHWSLFVGLGQWEADQRVESEYGRSGAFVGV